MACYGATDENEEAMCRAAQSAKSCMAAFPALVLGKLQTKAAIPNDRIT